jgi:hypothetical protein
MGRSCYTGKAGARFMGRPHSNGSVRKKKIKTDFPQIFIDKDSDFASTKLSPGIEAKSYVKDGFVFCEDSKGKIIEVQLINLSDLNKKQNPAA